MVKLKKFNSTRILILILLYLLPSYELFNFPLQNYLNFSLFVLTIYLIRNSKNVTYLIFGLIISIKLFGLFTIKNHYSLCLKSENKNISECENTFNQYIFFNQFEGVYKENINFGVGGIKLRILVILIRIGILNILLVLKATHLLVRLILDGSRFQLKLKNHLNQILIYQ